MPEMIKFILNGCDISFEVIAPKDITLEQLLKQCDRIKPDWCACGICSDDYNAEPEIVFDYDDVRISGDNVSCTILPKGHHLYNS